MKNYKRQIMQDAQLHDLSVEQIKQQLKSFKPKKNEEAMVDL